jgi:hypothetical protein
MDRRESVFRKGAIAILHFMWAQITAFKSSPFPAARAEHCHFDEISDYCESAPSLATSSCAFTLGREINRQPMRPPNVGP